MAKTATDKATLSIRSKQRFEAFCDCCCDIVVDPILLAFVVFMVFTRIQTIIDVTIKLPNYPLWIVLGVDIKMNLWIYISFLIVFALWATLKRLRYKREMSEKKHLTYTLEKINTNLTNLQKAIEDLPDKIAESIKPSSNEGNESQ